MRETKEIFFTYVFVWIAVTLAISTYGKGQESNKIILQNADIFSGNRLSTGEDVRELEGHVRFKQGNVRVWCDKATQFINRNEVELIGNVRVVRDTVTLTAKHGRYFGNLHKADCDGTVKLKTPNVTLYADYGTYYTEAKKAFFHNKVRIVDSTTTIFSDQLTYYENERKSIAISNVKIVNESDHVRMFGDYLEHFDSTRYSKMTEHPRLMQIDTTEKGEIDTLAVKSLVMESYDDSTKRLIATDSVVMVRGGLAARSGVVKYFRADDKLNMFQTPIVWYDENQVTGDSIFLMLRNNKLETASIKNRAFVLSQSDSMFKNRYNQLTGRAITMKFKENKLQETYVERNAISLYFLFDEKTPNGVNRTSGDFIRMKFNNGKPHTIQVSKGIEGTFYPENLVKKDEMKYNLDGFQLHSNRPSLQTVFPKLSGL
ncbi:MAG: OstA-like protein [Bacteroidota bacterium]|nr:OstA-like protein [Bacteroidota bacterium]